MNRRGARALGSPRDLRVPQSGRCAPCWRLRATSLGRKLPALGRSALCASAVLIFFSGALVRADERKTLSRTEDLVVLTGAELPKLRGIHKDLLRAYASRAGKLEPIPFQVDERTPELEYCWTSGPDPVKDVDDGRVDEDDEVAFRAADAGDRTTEGSIAGSTARMEIELEDPLDGGKGWVYVFAYEDKGHAPPARSERRLVEVLPDPAGGAVFRTTSFEVASTGSAGLTGRPRGIRFRKGDASRPAAVSDAAHLKLHASYLLGRIDREGSDARTTLGTSFIDGPVRALAPISLEVYLIWGNWISSSRSYVSVHDHTYEVHARFLVPVNLDTDHASEARLSVALADGTAWKTKALGSGTLGLIGPPGALAVTLELDPRLKSRPLNGGELGVDLTGLHKSDEARPYEVTYVLHALPEGTEEDLRALIRYRDKPLRHAAR